MQDLEFSHFLPGLSMWSQPATRNYSNLSSRAHWNSLYRAVEGTDEGSCLPTAPNALCVFVPQTNCPSTSGVAQHTATPRKVAYTFSTLDWASFTSRKYLSLPPLCILAAKQKYQKSKLCMLQNIDKDDKAVLNFCVCFTAYTFPLLPYRPARGCLAVPLLRWRTGSWRRAQAKSKFRITCSPWRAQQPNSAQPSCSQSTSSEIKTPT